MITCLINQIALAGFNFINSRIDAYRILKNKSIAHAINFISYSLFTTLVVLVGEYDLKEILLFCVSAFFNRQLSFDIPLNLRRGLPWYHQSTANPPKALMDKIERKFFGVDYDGKKIVLWYSIFYAISVTIYFIP